METYSVAVYSSAFISSGLNDFEEALHSSAYGFSIRHLYAMGITDSGDIKAALQKAMKVCALAGVNAADHYKPVYVFNCHSGATQIDWLMSKQGFSLIMMQLPLSENTARWLCELADI